MFLSHITFRTNNINLVQIQLQIQILKLIYIKSNTNLDVCRKPIKIIIKKNKTNIRINKLFQRVVEWKSSTLEN